MVDVLWSLFLAAGVVVAVAHGQPEEATAALFSGARQAVEVGLSLAPAMALWFGLSRAAAAQGWLDRLGHLLEPVVRRLIPQLGRRDPALAAIALNLAANLLGMGNAATPLGLQAMAQLQAENPHPERPSRPMEIFLLLNSVGVTVFPGTIIAYRAAAGAADPAAVAGPVAAATLVTAALALTLERLTYRRRPR